MRCAVIDIRGNSRARLEKFLITLYILNLSDLFFSKVLLWKAPELFNKFNMFLKPMIQGAMPYFIKIILVAIVLSYWYWKSEKSNITQMKRSLLISKILLGVYIFINIIHLINFLIYATV